ATGRPGRRTDRAPGRRGGRVDPRSHGGAEPRARGRFSRGDARRACRRRGDAPPHLEGWPLRFRWSGCCAGAGAGTGARDGRMRLWTFAARTIARNRRRTLLTLGVVVFGFSAIALAGGFMAQSLDGLAE